MYDVYMRFIDGTSVRFRARRFDISVARASAQEAKPRRFTYQDVNGRLTPVYLRLDQVAAIIVTPTGASSDGDKHPPLEALNFSEYPFSRQLGEQGQEKGRSLLREEDPDPTS